MPHTPSDIVESWITAVNAVDADRAASLTTPSVRIVGPRGVAEGHAVLRQWVAHAHAGDRRFARYRAHRTNRERNSQNLVPIRVALEAGQQTTEDELHAQ